MRLAILIFLCTVPCLAQDNACGSSIQIIEANGQLLIKNISDQPVTAYQITKFRSPDRKQLGTYRGSFSGGDSLAPGQTLEIGKAQLGGQFQIDHVRLANGWQCGKTPADGQSNEGDASPSR